MSIDRAILILEEWGASPEEIRKILDLEAGGKKDGYRISSWRSDSDIEERAAIVEIMDEYLRVLLPQNHARWTMLRNDAPLFAGDSPMSLLRSGKLSELRKVKQWLAGWLHG